MIKVGLLMLNLSLLKILIVNHLVVMLFAFITLHPDPTGTLIGIGALYPAFILGYILCNDCLKSNLGAALHLSEHGWSISNSSSLIQQHISLIACHEIDRVDLASLIEGHENHVRRNLLQG